MLGDWLGKWVSRRLGEAERLPHPEECSVCGAQAVREYDGRFVDVTCPVCLFTLSDISVASSEENR